MSKSRFQTVGFAESFFLMVGGRLKLARWLGIGMALLSLLLFPHKTNAFQVQGTAPQAGNKCVRWAQQPINIEIHQDGAPTIKDGSDIRAIREALKVWSAPSCNNLSFTIALTKETSFAGRKKDPSNPLSPLNRDGKSVIRFETKSWEWSEQELARNAVYFDPQTGKIKESDLLFNAVHWKWSTTQEGGTVDVKTVALARIGFFLGLWFSEVPGSMMYSGTDLMRTRHHLSPDDIAGSCFLYPTTGWKDPPPPKPKENPTAFEPPVREPPPTAKEKPSGNDPGTALPDGGGQTTPDTKKTVDTASPSDQVSEGGCKCDQSTPSPWTGLLLFVFFIALLLRRARHDHS